MCQIGLGLCGPHEQSNIVKGKKSTGESFLPDAVGANGWQAKSYAKLSGTNTVGGPASGALRCFNFGQRDGKV